MLTVSQGHLLLRFVFPLSYNDRSSILKFPRSSQFMSIMNNEQFHLQCDFRVKVKRMTLKKTFTQATKGRKLVFAQTHGCNLALLSPDTACSAVCHLVLLNGASGHPGRDETRYCTCSGHGAWREQAPDSSTIMMVLGLIVSAKC